MITHYLIVFLIMFIVPAFCITFLPGQVWAKKNIVSRDTDEDGKVNVWQTYRDDKPLERRTDNDGDGQIERMTFFDTQGLPKKSLHDLDRDGSMEVVRTYHEGMLCEQKKDLDQDGRFEIVTRFKDGEPVEQQKAANADGRFDIIHTFPPAHFHAFTTKRG